jgi:hypothetical protein
MWNSDFFKFFWVILLNMTVALASTRNIDVCIRELCNTQRFIGSGAAHIAKYLFYIIEDQEYSSKHLLSSSTLIFILLFSKFKHMSMIIIATHLAILILVYFITYKHRFLCYKTKIIMWNAHQNHWKWIKIWLKFAASAYNQARKAMTEFRIQITTPELYATNYLFKNLLITLPKWRVYREE